MKRAMAIGAAVSLCAAGMVGVVWGQQAPPRPVVLENGARIVLLPCDGATRVGMEAFYDAGFLDEPRGQTQCAHLIEHLVCMSATTSHAAGQSWQLLSEHGMVNAETLGDFTHYDYEVPAADLELILKIESERLAGPLITPEVVAQETPRIYAETDAVESNPVAPLFKHALMAANQAWRYRAPSALVRGGLDEIPVADLARFHAGVHAPSHLTLVLVGGFKPDEAMALARRHVGTVPARPAKARALIPWADLPARATVRWDTGVTGVVLAWPPPPDDAERLALSIYAEILGQRLQADGALAARTRFVLCSNSVWPVGDLSFFLYATLKPGVDPGDGVAALVKALDTATSRPPGPSDMEQIRAFASAFWPGVPTWEQALARARALPAGFAATPEQGAGHVLLHGALQTGIRMRLAGPRAAETLAAVAALDSGALDAVLKRTLEPARMRAAILEPAGRAAQGAR